MKIKRCNRCHNEKDLINFAKNKRSKDGLNPTCRDCKKEISLKKIKFNQENRLIPESGVKVCNKCKEDKSSDKFCKNKNTIDGYHRYCKLCKTKENIQNQEYNINYYYSNKENYTNIYYPKQNITKKTRYENDPVYKVSILLRNRLSKILKRENIYKNNTTVKLLGCSFKEFKQYIESKFMLGMTWNNLGEIWELDHIIPISKFNLLVEENQLICFNYKNLQPLFKTTEIAESFGYTDQIGNRNKSNKII